MSINRRSQYFNELDIDFISAILGSLIENNLFNYRKINQIDGVKLINLIEKNYKSSDAQEYLKCRLLKIAILLNLIFGEYTILTETLEQMEKTFESNEEKMFENKGIDDYYKYYLMPVFYYKKHNWKHNAEFTLTPSIIKAKLISESNGWSAEYIGTPYHPNPQKQIWPILLKSIEILREQKLF